ncbi:UDP-N-acetylmuramate--L-alanine ligase [Dermacoccus sp. PAMC28757]|uniref:UDP-N-acetylmuramate--L-alanine ligase n=1 Tax=Dermacoccus sp. PAMC28757 TaxID=2762331 RepID=UPI002103D1EE|nr:UDP-N-acetylmuramate--L-alanine ligase [Dermacoccus sp. PAMC28757]
MSMGNGVNERFDFSESLPNLADVPHVHMIAVGGSGMSGVARLFLADGVQLSGSDNVELPVLDDLRAQGARIAVGYAAANVAEVPDGAVVVVSSAINELNPELVEVRRRGLRVLHRSQGLAMLMQGRRGLAVAGANGKTTTSGMATAALAALGEKPSFAIGANVAGLGVNAAPGEGDVFVVEADESDGSFVVYHPDVAIVTNIKDDHLDFYGTSANLAKAYEIFAATIATDGLLVACADDDGSRALADERREAGARVLTYGRSDDADVRIVSEHGAGFAWGARVALPGGREVDLALEVPGAHNVLNATGVLTALVEGLGIDAERAAHSLSAFRGTSRRFEPRGEAAGVRVVDDYAHNPGKLEALVRTADALKESGRLFVVFQPHLYSRTRNAALGLAEALDGADRALVLDVYGAREQPVEGVSGRLITDAMTSGVATFTPTADDALAVLLEEVRSGDLVVTVGAGDITHLGPRILEGLERR